MIKKNLSGSLRSPAQVVAPSSCFVQLHSHLAGHCPNNSSLNPPLAAVVVVAPKGGAYSSLLYRPI